MELSKRDIEDRIYTVRGVQVMLDSHLAELYQVETKALNQAVKRNIDRFPDGFRFQLTDKEFVELNSMFESSSLRSQSVTSNSRGGRRYNPYVFTEQGVAMLSAVLRSDIAIKVSIQIMQAFVAMRKFLINNASVFQRLDQVELKQLKTDEKVEQIFKALEAGKPEPNQGIFFDGQIFNAYVFASDLIKKAQQEIILMDNYMDETTLTHLAKKAEKVKVLLFTKSISKQLLLDVKKANQQYGNSFEIKELKNSHDRFLIIDRNELYHIGASLKDLGKKWFAFSKMEKSITNMILEQLNKEMI
jgi:hypothetical protein